ncbi:uncharacterized protein LOC8268422 isoform X2 [Ricinus communis]|uniref:DNA binding protein, putative n=1 Tax=Ricinus communis TaxID=3988 RepID=B9RJX9_RICCO|nr:uncharacterized protein LOC8268422 isoform X2 [Ricinus communis]EEF48631.1 DNA binding protein, putative [Ricinus communis]|eukprot:XP_002514048.1 uncharacterized protein LOC8268422 isoform X2 [Ricinus communis]
MIEKSKKHNSRKGLISEEDISSLLQRYTANTVLALLQEVAQFEGVKIDWNALVKKTTTGIKNVREYQMLWRHLAYKHTLIDNLDDGAQPLDDDSDLEYELEAFPDVSSEASAEAAACVKVLIASGATSDSTHPNSATVEAPLTINIPNGQSARAISENSQPATMRGMNITVPVSIQKQPLPTVASTEVFDGNGLGNGNIPPRRKRKPWSEAEDLELIAAVQKYGEGNWANILRSEFTWDRTASQLSQRWAIIRKRHGNWNPVGNTSGVQLSEEWRAARHAMNLALDPPVKNKFTNNISGEATPAQHQSQRPFAAKSSPMVPLGSAPKSQIAVKRPAKPDLSSDPVRATAVAAGARIATQSDAASLLKAAQAKNAVHIMPTGGSSMKSALPGGASNHSEAHPNVHTNDLAAGSRSTLPVVSPSAIRPAASSTVQHIPSISDTAKNISAKQFNAELPARKDTETAGAIKILSEDAKEQQVKEHGACVSGNELSKQVQEEKAAFPNREAECKTQLAVSESSSAASKLEMADSNMMDVLGKPAEGSQNSNSNIITCLSVKTEDSMSAIQVNGDKQITSDKPDRISMAIDKFSEKIEAVSKSEPDTVMTEGES